MVSSSSKLVCRGFCLWLTEWLTCRRFERDKTAEIIFSAQWPPQTHAEGGQVEPVLGGLTFHCQSSLLFQGLALLFKGDYIGIPYKTQPFIHRQHRDIFGIILRYDQGMPGSLGIRYTPYFHC